MGNRRVSLISLMQSVVKFSRIETVSSERSNALLLLLQAAQVRRLTNRENAVKQNSSVGRDLERALSPTDCPL